VIDDSEFRWMRCSLLARVGILEYSLISVRCSNSKHSGREDEKVTASLRTAKICDLHADQKVGRYRYDVQCHEVSTAQRVNEFDIRCSTVKSVDESA